MVEYLEDFFGTTIKWGKETSDGKYFICNFFIGKCSFWFDSLFYILTFVNQYL